MDSIEQWLEWPEWARDAVVNDVSVRFGWRDRLLILLGRPVLVTVKTHTEHAVGRSDGRTRVTVSPIRWPWQPERFGEVTDGWLPS